MSSVPALQLYRSIRKAHKKFLPPKLRGLGDTYIKTEFKLHKSVVEEKQLKSFMEAWNDYLSQIETTGRREKSVQSGMLDEPFPSSLLRGTDDADKGSVANKQVSFGKDLPSGIELSEEQQEQLQKLQQEAKKPS